MKLHETLEPGQSIKLESEARKKTWPSSIQAVDDHITVVFPQEDLEGLEPGAELAILIGADKGLTKMRVRVLGEPVPEPGTLNLAPLEEGAQVVQRRAHFRMEKPLVDVSYRIIRESADLMNKEWHDAEVINLSGGGAFIRVISESEILLGTQMMLRISDLSTDETINTVANVIRCTKKKEPADTYEINLNFAVIDEKDRDKLISWLFREQLERAGHHRP